MKGQALKKLRASKVKALVILLLFFLLLFSAPRGIAFAGENGAKSPEEIEDELNGNIDEQLNGLDFSQFEKLIERLNSGGNALFGGTSFGDKVRSIINGDFKIGYDSALEAITAMAFGSIAEVMPLFATVVGIAVLSSLLNNMRSDKSKSGAIVYYACYAAVIIVVAYAVFSLVNVTKNTVNAMQEQMNVIFPVLLSFITALGGTSSAAVYQPVAAMLSTFVSEMMTHFILPLFIFSFVFNIIGNLSPNVKLGKFSGFIGSLSKWCIGLVFAVFSAFMTVQGITAATYDGVSIKTARYAISHYIPIVGGYLSEGLNLIIAGSVLIKNAVGMSALLLLAATVMAPLISVIVMSLGLKLTAAVLEPLSESGYSSFVSAAAKSLNMLIAVLLSVAFMYFITLLLIISTGNQLFVS
ncbi:MAG: stage III sporulation protein AE [Clostridiales bacterium]|nr:stage III sporulation protein AE [Clostridiales bacterium]